MRLLKSIILASTVTLISVSAQAQSCVDLCDENWWSRASSTEISATIAAVDVHARDEDGFTPLIYAARFGRAESVMALLDAGADINAQVEGLGFTALIAAAGFGSSENVMALLNAGADISARERSGQTVLMAAARYGNSESVMALLEAGADVNVREEALGFTPLMYAAQYGDAKRVMLLLDAGADVNVRSESGSTAFGHAWRNDMLTGTKAYLRLKATQSE